MAVTSANLSGDDSPSTPAEVYAQLGGRIPLILDGGQTPGGMPSTVVDCTKPELHLLRSGPLALETLQEVLKGL
jgi:L-threonylcarbamoyladenylate synthase